MKELERFFYNINGGEIILTILIITAAFLCSFLVKKFIEKLVMKVNTGKNNSVTQESKKELSTLIGNIGFLVIFTFFIPEILTKLNLEYMTKPFDNILATISGYIPNVIIAMSVIIVGTYLAKIIKQITYTVLEKININKIQEKYSVSLLDNERLTNAIANIIYCLVLIPIIIVGLSTLNIPAISNPTISILTDILSYIPNILMAIIIIVVGFILSGIAKSLLGSIIAATGIDGKIKKTFANSKFISSISASNFIASVVKYVLVLLFVVEGLRLLNLEVLYSLGYLAISYLPNVIIAIVLVSVAVLTCEFVEGKLQGKVSPLSIKVLKILTLVIAGFMVLSQLGIATNIVETSFVRIVSGVALAFGLAFGLGGKNFAEDLLKNIKRKDKDK